MPGGPRVESRGRKGAPVGIPKHLSTGFFRRRTLLHVIVTPDDVVMGMTYRADDDPEINPDDRRHILTGCARLDPSVVAATDLRDCLGFRPVRRVVRLEVERRSVAGRRVAVVHNYGHGGSGITLHWGCAKEATSLVQDAILRHRVKL